MAAQAELQRDLQQEAAIIEAYEAEFLLDRAEIEAEAQWLIENRHLQPEIIVPYQEHHDNARTALMEAMTASGFLSRVEIDGPDIETINQQVLNRLLNGWDDKLPPHEQKRRFAELCEELTIQKVHRGIVAGVIPENTAVAVISDIATVEMPGLGYRYKNRKGMARSTHLRRNVNGGYTRIIEQISRSNSGVETTGPFLNSCQIEMAQDCPSDVAGLNQPIIYSEHDWIDGVVDIQRQLDRIAGPNILYGDNVADKPNHPQYDKLRQESARREKEVEAYINDLAKFEVQLEDLQYDGKITPEDARKMFEGEVSRILDAICSFRPEYAEATFGAASVPRFYQIAEHIRRGEIEEANQLRLENNQFKDQIIFCGSSISIEEAQAMGLQVNSYGELIEKGKENWPWKQGVCQVEQCPTRPGKTDVGPCNVCHRCQDIFDAGGDPTKPNLLDFVIMWKADKAEKAAKAQKPTKDSTIKS